jgi:hypothetical protein
MVRRTEYRTEYFNDNGELHRTDGPAIIIDNGTLWWMVNDELHRLDGPAIELYDGRKNYYINNIIYSEKDYYNHLDVIVYNRSKKLKAILK